MSNGRQLRRNTDDKIIAGVASGTAEFFNMDTTLVRIIWAILGFFGPGIIIYLVMWLVVPEKGTDEAVVDKLAPSDEADEEE
jgi:phage shock protein C